MPIRPEMAARYPKDWKARSRFVRFYRARNRCEWCGAENYQPHPITGSKVILTTAHVYDMRPEASDLLNLARCASGAITATMPHIVNAIARAAMGKRRWRYEKANRTMPRALVS